MKLFKELKRFAQRPYPTFMTLGALSAASLALHSDGDGELETYYGPGIIILPSKKQSKSKEAGSAESVSLSDSAPSLG